MVFVSIIIFLISCTSPPFCLESLESDTNRSTVRVQGARAHSRILSAAVKICISTIILDRFQRGHIFGPIWAYTKNYLAKTILTADGVELSALGWKDGNGTRPSLQQFP